MSFKAYGKFVEVEPVVPDSSLIKLAEGADDNRSVFKVLSVGHEVEGVVVGANVFAIRTAKFYDKQTGVSVRLCHQSEIVAVDPDGEEIVPVRIVEVVPIDPSLN